MRESDIEAALVAHVTAMGGMIRKVKWVGRDGAPDRLVLFPNGRTVWVEVKSPKTILSFPSNAHERMQHREHERMRSFGQDVRVIGTVEAIRFIP